MGILLIAALKCKALPLLRLACLDADLAHSQQRLFLRSAPGNHGLNPIPHALPHIRSLPAQLQQHQVP